MVPQPFSNPQRLLVEAKSYSKKIGLETIRNAVGVAKDVSECWFVGHPGGLARRRYHYQYAIFSLIGRLILGDRSLWRVACVAVAAVAS